MDKKTRGLPPSFQLDVARAAVEGPVQLGDYLDEEEAADNVVAAFVRVLEIFVIPIVGIFGVVVF